MKIQRRFVLHVLLGFIMYILLLGIALPITYELILPFFGLSSGRYDWVGFVIVVLITIPFIVLFGWYVGSPLLLILKWIDELSKEDFSAFQPSLRMYTKKGTLKMRYRLYQEVIAQLDEMQRQLKRAQIERKEVDDAKRDWMAGISHDLKTPLTYVKGYSNLLLHVNYDWTKEEEHRFIKEINSKVEHMEELISDLNVTLRFDDQQSIIIHTSKQNIMPVIQEILADLSNDVRHQNIQFELTSKEERISFPFNEQILRRALQNIYMNAMIHNEQDITIETTVTQDVNHVSILIRDDGKGMSPETLQKLFNRYYRGTTTDQQSEGTGLGMAIVKHLIEAHDGTIEVESGVNQGSIFTITLPK